VIIGVFGVSSPATAIPVEDAGTHALLAQMLAEMKTQTALMEEQSTTLNEIKDLNEDILDAICGKSTLGNRIASLTDTDYQNAGSVALGLVSDELPEGIPTPQLSDIASIETTIRKLYGMARQAQHTANRAKRTVDQVSNADLNTVARVGRAVLAEARRQRMNVHVDAVEGALSFSAYSLSDGTSAKGREVALDQARGAADCLREDIKALNRTNIELTRRINHLIMLQASDVSARATEQLQALPLNEISDEEQNR
jgi:uncharacterized protein GlcG (DUF336 family)